jgi:FtsH-binding integral membrane protein
VEVEMGSMRYMNIGLGVSVAIIVAGVVAFRDSSEVAMQAVALVGMFVGLALGLWLDTRAQRRDGKRAQ